MGGDRKRRSKIGKLTRRRPFTASSHAAPRPRGIFSPGYDNTRHNTDSEEDSESARGNANDWWYSDDSCFSSDPPSPTESNESDLWGDSVGSAVSDQPPYLCDDKCFEVPSTTACGPVDKYSPKADGLSTVAAGISPYTPIRPWQFRILELFPGQGGATPRGRLIPVTLTLQQGRYCAVSGPIDHGKILHYRALSYAWGRSAADRFLELNDGAIPITKNLHGALLHLRDAEASRYVWVDAVCIDQTSFSERGQQVSNMLQIFQTADGVDVWLGDSLDDSDLAMAYLDLNRIDRNSPHGWRTYHSEVCMEHAARLRGPLVRLFARPWLRRTWVRQEVYAARELIVHCGSRTVTWDCFLNGLAVARFLAHRLDFGESEFETNLYYRAAHQLAQELETNTETLSSAIKSSRDFPTVLSAAHHYGATDKRDAAYAVLGMCSVDISVADGDRLNKRKRSITVDYTRSIDEVWTDVAVYILSDPKTRLSKSGKLPEHIANIFNLTDLPPDRQRAIASRNDFDLAPGAPAWVFDWHSRRNLNDMNLLRDVLGPGYPGDLRYHLYPRFFRARHAKDEYFRHSPPRAIDEQRLRVRAYIVGVVGEVTNRTCSFDAFIKGLMTHQQRHSAAPKDFASRKLQESSDTRCLARIRTKARAGKDMKVRDRSCVALVPIAARSGDLVVTIASNVLPLVITPRTKSSPQLDGLHVGSRISSQYHDSDDDAGEIGALRPDWLLLGPLFGNMRLAGPSFPDSREFMLH